MPPYDCMEEEKENDNNQFGQKTKVNKQSKCKSRKLAGRDLMRISPHDIHTVGWKQCELQLHC